LFREGPNTIVVTASEPDGTVQQELRTIFFDKPKVAVVAPPPPPAPPARTSYAVVVGVGRYESPGVPRLRYTVPDAEAIYQALTGPAGFNPEHVLLLTDKTERKPTLRNLKWALGTFLARSAQKDDTVLIFFAGHGAPEIDQRGIERDGLAKYLIPSDADPDDLYSSALPMDELQTIFGRIEAERVVVFLDTCYSGAAGGRTFVAKKTRATTVDDLFLERLTRSKGRAIITASRTNEVSLEVAEYGHGLFTHFLLQGLEGAADLNRDGIVTLQELYEYVEQQVSQKARAVGGNQHPVMKGELEGVLPLLKVEGPRK
ncbi:MAG TPA: caspase family protein, partial [Candidatus Acidoferrum sp.]|nr:caspase family protein [Candidatus Acidoferrum sp.]